MTVSGPTAAHTRNVERRRMPHNYKLPPPDRLTSIRTVTVAKSCSSSRPGIDFSSRPPAASVHPFAFVCQDRPRQDRLGPTAHPKRAYPVLRGVHSQHVMLARPAHHRTGIGRFLAYSGSPSRRYSLPRPSDLAPFELAGSQQYRSVACHGRRRVECAQGARRSHRTGGRSTPHDRNDDETRNETPCRVDQRARDSEPGFGFASAFWQPSLAGSLDDPLVLFAERRVLGGT
jgi:hypothetical protein